MSHKATNWAIQQRGLKPAVKLLLWHLADRHNVDHGCFPDQATLARDAEMSRASVNRHLIDLEEAGLIRRVQRTNAATGKQLSTRYVLAFEEDFEALDVVPRVSDCDTAPCLKSSASRVSKSAETVSHGYETLTCKGTRKEPSSLRDEDAHARFAELWQIFPLRPGQSRASALKAFLKLSDQKQIEAVEGGRRKAAEVEASRKARGETVERSLQFVPALIRWIEAEGWNDLPPAVGQAASPDLAVVAPGTPDFDAVMTHMGDRVRPGKSGALTVRRSDLEEARRLVA